MDKELIELLRGVKDKWGQETVAAILKKLDSYPVRWRGTLRRSVMYSQQPGPDGDIDFDMADYGQFIDDGIGIFGPRKQPIKKKSIPGIAFHLKQWATSKNLNSWAVATNIQKRGGIKPRPFFNSVIDSRVPILGEAITDAYTTYLENKLNNIQ
jgi:hypothetical protein